MKTTSFAVATLVALFLIGCADNSNPVQPTSQTNDVALAKSVTGDPMLDKHGNNVDRVEGKVTAVDVAAGTITIGRRVIQTDWSTKIERNGKHVSLGKIMVGDQGEVRLYTGTMLAIKVEAQAQL